MAAKRRGYWLERHRPSRYSGALWWLASGVGLAVLGWVFYQATQVDKPAESRAGRHSGGWEAWRFWSKPSAAPAPRALAPAPSPHTSAPPRLARQPAPQPLVVSNEPSRVSMDWGRTNGVALTNGPSSTRTKPTATSNAPPATPDLTLTSPRCVQDLLEAQVALARQGISAGSVDGVLGSQTRAALRLFQKQQSLPTTGILDTATKLRLILEAPAVTNYSVTEADCQRLTPVPKTWLGKSEARRLDFETMLELVSEKARAHPELIRKLNPQIAWNRTVPAGTVVTVPWIEKPSIKNKATGIRIHLSAKTLEVLGADNRLLGCFPCSIARQVEKRPVGDLSVISVVENPNYSFNPAVFPESAEARSLGRKLILPPGPNNPVGVAWIGLDKPGYGIHGTPKPEDVGRTESHGCFRLANWNAEYLAQIVSIGTPVTVEP